MTTTTNYTRQLLKMIPGVEVVEMKLADECCGLGGPWGLTNHYDLSVKMRKDKINSIVETGADTTTSWCFGCMIQMRDGLQQEKVILRLSIRWSCWGRRMGEMVC